jgi:serine/threonine-protein kinase
VAPTLFAERYELRELAGRGGMAEVWLAQQHGAAGFSRPVGLKRILPHLASRDLFVRMFIEEARVCAQLVHPNIVQIYDFGVERGLYFLVMEWVEGVNLTRFLEGYDKRGLIPPWPIVAAIAIEALKALGAAHERIDQNDHPSPVIHRDVTPANILLGVSGIVKLSDFGLARAMDRARLTDPDVIKGKIGYLAPELTQGGEASVRSDLYALGVTLWQALAARRLFVGQSDAEVFVRAREANVPPLRELRPDLPRELSDTIQRSLARDPGDRYPSAHDMRLQITRLLRRHPISTDPKLIARAVVEAREALGIGRSSQPPPLPPLPVDDR